MMDCRLFGTKSLCGPNVGSLSIDGHLGTKQNSVISESKLKIKKNLQEISFENVICETVPIWFIQDSKR